MFAYLAAQEGRPVHRDVLAGVLWDEELPATWEKALRVLMTKLRALLEECGIDGTTALTSAFGCYKLTLPDGAWIDVEAAAEALERGEAELAVGDLQEATLQASTSAALARRVFLPGEDGPWVEEKRRELRDLLVRSLECLRDAAFASGDSMEAVRHAEEVTQLEPFRESGYRRLMESHVAAGNPAEALRVYERCRRFLADELGAYPSAETEAAYLEILRSEKETSESEESPSLPPAPRPVRLKRAVLLGIGVLLLATGIAIAAVQLNASSSGLQTIDYNRCSALHYRGPGSPERLIVADLPLQPGVLDTTRPMVDAITLALERHNYKAGQYRVGLQVCNDGAGDNVAYDPVTCVANARAYAANPSVIGVVGPFSSMCAKLEIPTLNRAPGGSVAIVSPSNTYVGLTRHASDAAKGEPSVYYPTGRRNYARVVPTDDVEVAADAMVAQRLGVKRVYVLVPAGYPAPIVEDYVIAASNLGIEIAGRRVWSDKQRLERLAASVAGSRADGVFLVGSSRGLLQALRARLGREVPLISSGFDPATAVLAGVAAEGMTISYPGPAIGRLRGEGARFVASFSKKFGAEPDRFAVNAAQAIDVLLDAIARSDGTRASVTKKLFATRVSNGILGSFWITPTGDTTLNAVAIYRVTGGKVTTFKTVIVPDTLVASD
ncbi:MAG TPA: BTAD domain-containing putative transcriptional regulator [Gaiellaceae bacterium]|nr:BTAD domain-containing putative transcriptional regulator [Gaiellaceae bacterium]